MNNHNCRIKRVFVKDLVCGREIHKLTSYGMEVFRLEGVDATRVRAFSYVADREA